MPVESVATPAPSATRGPTDNPSTSSSSQLNVSVLDTMHGMLTQLIEKQSGCHSADASKPKNTKR
ncbi:hypothetical protein, partial [Acinetobacter baumannii]|uniref:hypothetical protein n=1 Tax=Acinetobacter baumannii TaxID=470 RepID=UPI001C068970